MSGEDSKVPIYFQWIIENKLAAFAFPSRQAHLRYLLENNIRILISLLAYPRPPVENFSEIRRYEIAVEEFEAPTLSQTCKFVEILENALRNDEPVGVHCLGGRGRAGTMIAAYFVHSLRISAAEAIDKIRKIRPYSIETEEQELAVYAYEEHLRKSAS